jgi:tRNA threonylcarbamoyladenosine biosynthesis protein TsaE
VNDVSLPTWSLLLADAEQTAALGAALARALQDQPGAMIHLQGDLGAGKTTLARGLLQALGVTGKVRSPTYTLMEPYELPGRVALHMDLYRLVDPLELQNLGLGDYPADRTLWLVEWPEQGGALLPPADLQLRLNAEQGGRRAELRLGRRLRAALLIALDRELKEFLKVEH